jgi:hypothetical protein
MALVAATAALPGAGPGRVTGVMSEPMGPYVPGTTVWVVAEDCRRSYSTTVEPQTGRFAFEAIPPGTYSLVGYSLGFISRRTGEFQVESGVTTEVNLEMYLGSFDGGGIPKGEAPLNGRVVDEADRPITGAVVTDSRANSYWEESVSGEDGRFGTCRMPPGKVNLVVKHPEYRTRSLRLKVGIHNYSDGHLEIKLRKR